MTMKLSEANAGFTLIELMVTVSILAIVSMIAVPSFRDMLRNGQLTTVTNEFVGALTYARSEAVKRGRRVTICKSDAPEAANPVCATSNDPTWQKGWLIFVDGSTSGTFDGTDIRLKVGQLSSSNMVITEDSTFDKYVSYLPSGLSKGRQLSSGKIDIALEGQTRSININVTGRIRISKSDNAYD
jgi:type IV fimbrial biogenesis protein FimT